MFSRAEVAKLADALDSGSSGGNLMGVQLPPSAPTLIVKLIMGKLAQYQFPFLVFGKVNWHAPTLLVLI
jgi:hypothetical protein